MNQKFMNAWSRLKGILSGKWLSKKILWALLAAILALGTIYSLRSCSSRGPGKKIFLIGRESSWYPMELAGKEKNLTAFTNDILSLIAQENDVRLEWYETTSSGLIDGLDNGTYDFILTAMRPNFVNKEKYNFSSLIFEFGPVLLVRQDSTITTLKELHGMTVGINYGFSWANNAQKIPDVNSYDIYFSSYGNMSNALDDLINDKIDGVIMQSIPAYNVTQGLYAGKLKVVTPPFSDEGLRIVSVKNSPYANVIKVIDESIEKMRENGTYDSLIAKWNLVDPASHYWHPPKGKDK